MSKEITVKVEEIEKNALYSDKEKTSLSSIFGKKEDFKNNLFKIEYRWNLAGFPQEIISLLRSFVDTGTIYVLIDEQLRASLSTYVTNFIHILENETDKNTFNERLKRTGKILEETLIPYFTEFSKAYPSGAIIFYILIKSMLSSILIGEMDDKSQEFKKRTEKEITRLTNNVLSFVKKSSHLLFKEFVTNFTNTLLRKIPILTQSIADIGSAELEEILLAKGLSLSLFNQLYNLLLNELKQTIEKNLLQTLFSQQIKNKQDLFKNIDFPISQAASEEIIKTVKQSVTKTLLSLEQKNLELEKEIKKNFDGYDETSKLLWDSINTEIKSIKDGRSISNLDEVTDRSSILSSFINKKMWSIRELLRRKKKIDFMISNLRKLEALSKDDLIKFSSELEKCTKIEGLADFYFAFIKHYGRSISKIPSKIVTGVEKILKLSERTEKKEIFDTFCKKHFITKKYFPDKLLFCFLKCFEDIIIPLYIQNTLMRFFSIWPPVSIKEGSKDLQLLEKEVLYVGDYLIPENKYLKLGMPYTTQEDEHKKGGSLMTVIVNQFSRLVSVLVYDIRGSTFMGLKLENAEIESSIRKKFSEKMLKIAEKYGAFPVKDTGDGGILFFAENSRELYGKIYAPGRIGNEWMRVKYKKEDLMIKEGEESAKFAVLTAKEMMLEAQKFVSENIHEYSDWFKEEKERNLFFKGMNYAQLPPSYKRIFQIGIGITSGHVGKDIFFSINAFGDPDITGNLVRDANLYSNARHPDSSVILMDSSSLLNLLINEEIIEPIVVEERVGDFSETEIYRYLFEKTIKLARIREKKTDYKLKNYGLIIERIGHRILEKGKDERIIPSLSVSELGFTINDAGEFRDKKGGIIKFFYEVSLEE